VIALLIAIVVVAVLMGLAFAIGGVVLPILLVLAGLVAVGWVLLAGIARRTPSEIGSAPTSRSSSGPAARTTRAASAPSVMLPSFWVTSTKPESALARRQG
jgi:hypothetical protein